MDSGYFIEQVFPLYGVRFISVSDGFDSNDYKNDTGGIDVAFKFLMHEHYSRDLSIKIKSAQRVKRQSGAQLSGSLPYGYRINSSKQWESDPESADTVRLIFKMAIDGCTTTKIRDTLFQNGVPTPKEVLDIQRGKAVEPQCRWSTDAVQRIIANEQYAGTYISGRYERAEVGSTHMVQKDKSEWVVIHDHHIPLVSREDFDQAQSSLPVKGSSRVTNEQLAKKRVKKDGSAIGLYPLYGYVFTDQHEPVINPTPAEAIRRIFEMALDGKMVSEICEALTNAGYPAPGEQKALDRGENITPGKAWTRGAVNGILREIQYTGTAASGRSVILAKRPAGEEKPRVPRNAPPTAWRLTPNARPPIVTETEYNTVQALLSGKPTRKRSAREFLLKNKVRCGVCGHSLDYDDGVGHPMFRCGHTACDPAADCHKMKFAVKDIDEAVLTIIRKQAEVILNAPTLNELAPQGELGFELSDCEKRVSDCNERRQALYEQFVLREIDRAEYIKRKAEYTDEIDRIAKQAAALRAEEQARTAQKSTLALAKRTVGEETPHREIVDALIDRVSVFPDKRIEIIWKVADFVAAG